MYGLRRTPPSRSVVTGPWFSRKGQPVTHGLAPLGFRYVWTEGHVAGARAARTAATDLGRRTPPGSGIAALTVRRIRAAAPAVGRTGRARALPFDDGKVPDVTGSRAPQEGDRWHFDQSPLSPRATATRFWLRIGACVRSARWSGYGRVHDFPVRQPVARAHLRRV